MIQIKRYVITGSILGSAVNGICPVLPLTDVLKWIEY